MKRKFFFAASMLMAAFTLASFTACSSDDDNEGDENGTSNEGGNGNGGGDVNVTPGQAPSSALVDLNGNKVYVSSITSNYYSSISFYYNSGQLAGFDYYGEEYKITGSSFTLKYDDGDATAYVETNSQGLISKVKIVEDWSYGSEWEKGNALISYTYNAANQLVNVSFSYNEEWVDEDEKGTSSSSGSVSNTWSNGNLTKSVQTETAKEEWTDEYGQKRKWDYKYDGATTFSYGNQSNQIKQVPLCLAEEMSGSMDALCIMGFFGVGPANLPTSMSQTHVYVEDGEREEYSSNYNYSFTLNTNGTISTETQEYIYEYGQAETTYTWQYGTGGRAAVAKQAESLVQDVKKMFPLRSHSRRHHKK